jgi:hypothetical protein
VRKFQDGDRVRVKAGGPDILGEVGVVVGFDIDPEGEIYDVHFAHLEEEREFVADALELVGGAR